ncbi:MAG: glycoside hydrolase family 27 protein [Terriglobales bacterium]
MGWNSWDSFATSIDEAQVKATARFMARRLRRYGWQYVVIDEGWYEAAAPGRPESERLVMDRYGRYLPDPGRFPSARNGAGLKPLADYIHSLGLRFGIHILRGIPRQAVERNLPIAGSSFRGAQAADPSDTCPWNSFNYGIKAESPAGRAYYDSIARLYAGWGVDFVKADCIASHPYKGGEIRDLSRALRATGRPIVLSLSPGPAPLAQADALSRFASMWRISDDVWDLWRGGAGFPQGIVNQFARAAAWERYAGPGHWPDADMLPLGPLQPRPGWGRLRASRLTAAEQRTMLTAWCMFRSPLMMGGNLLLAGADTLRLLTNPEVIAVDQHSVENRALPGAGPDTAVWLARPARGAGYYLALFNLGDRPRTLAYGWRALGLPGARYDIRDLWARRNLGAAPRVTAALAPHASALYRLAPR